MCKACMLVAALHAIHMHADDDPLALTKLELDKKKTAPADKRTSASAGCDQCHSTAAMLYAVLVCCHCGAVYTLTATDGVSLSMCSLGLGRKNKLSVTAGKAKRDLTTLCMNERRFGTACEHTGVHQISSAVLSSPQACHLMLCRRQ